MPLPKITRPLNDLEKRYLRLLGNQKAYRIKQKPSYTTLVVCIAGSIVFTCIATSLQNQFSLFVTGTAAVLCFSALVFGPYEYYKSRKRLNEQYGQLNNLLQQNTITTTVVSATRVAVAEEFNDEGAMFILECGAEEVLIFEDYTFQYAKRLPCLNFEVYSSDYYELTGIQVYTTGKKCDAIVIDGAAKERYFKKHGYPGQMVTINRGFDELVQEIRNA